MNKKFLLILILILLLTACSRKPDESFIQTAIAQTLAMEPTSTKTNTIIPSFTFTPTSTNTNTPTNSPTPTNTNTPTPTETNTPLPPATLTQIWREATQTKSAYFKTATAMVRDATATEIASYTTIYWKELATYPENYIGVKVKVNGRVFNVLGTVIQIYFAGTYEALYVNLRSNASGIYDGDSITVYGVVQGTECFTNTLGNQVCQPALKDAWYTKP